MQCQKLKILEILPFNMKVNPLYIKIKFILFHYCPPTKLREGSVFTNICQSVHGGGTFPCGTISHIRLIHYPLNHQSTFVQGLTQYLFYLVFIWNYYWFMWFKNKKKVPLDQIGSIYSYITQLKLLFGRNNLFSLFSARHRT